MNRIFIKIIIYLIITENTNFTYILGKKNNFKITDQGCNCKRAKHIYDLITTYVRLFKFNRSISRCISKDIVMSCQSVKYFLVKV